MNSHDDLDIAKITNDKEWQAYRELFEAENNRRGIKAEPLPEQRPEPSPEVKLSQTIDKAIALWQRDSQGIKNVLSGLGKQLQKDSQYHYYQARTYLENTVSGAMGIVEDTLGLSHQQSVNYFIDPSDFLSNEVVEEQPTVEAKEQPAEQDNFINKIVAKGVDDIASVEQAMFGLFDRFRGR